MKRSPFIRPATTMKRIEPLAPIAETMFRLKRLPLLFSTAGGTRPLPGGAGPTPLYARRPKGKTRFCEALDDAVIEKGMRAAWFTQGVDHRYHLCRRGAFIKVARVRA